MSSDQSTPVDPQPAAGNPRRHVLCDHTERFLALLPEDLARDRRRLWEAVLDLQAEVRRGPLPGYDLEEAFRWPEEEIREAWEAVHQLKAMLGLGSSK